ncbi:S-layer homology domain-containing protein [Cohnella candidum]|uniref:SLH domain-containing protein n=1 Tax=Cohnella candidum TaxID=2674991 RepID=A0A3G3K2I9_9BACL|nr:S-layer homology domain-containing protein [Cohnella candidum]AYQ74391.1 hypothetical protein EAV92_18535 [Cohnella candidum]
MEKRVKKLVVASLLLSQTLLPMSVIHAAGSEPKGSLPVHYSDFGAVSSWGRDAVNAMQSLGIMTGDQAGRFRPTQAITREELASVLAKTLELPLNADGGSAAADVQSADWSNPAIEAVVSAGIMDLDATGCFRPKDRLTREELAVYVSRAVDVIADAGSTAGSQAPEDQAAISPWAKDGVHRALDLKLMRGDGTLFRPQALATRQEVAVLLLNALNSGYIEGTIGEVTYGQVVIGGIAYRVDVSLTGLFARTNAASLKGAGIRYAAEDNVIRSVASLELNAAGVVSDAEFEGNQVLDGSGSVINGSLTVNADFVTVRNLKVRGELLISANLQHDFYSDGLNVEGETSVNGGDSNTVVFNNAILGAVNVNKQDVRVEPKGKSVIGEMTVNTSATITADAGVTIPKLTLSEGAKNVQIDAAVGTLEVLNSTAKLDVKKPIEKIVLPEGAKASDLLMNFDQIKDLVKDVQVGTTSTPITPKPPTPATPKADTTPPSAPSVTGAVYEDTESIAGTAEAGTSIVVRVGDQVVGHGYAASNGSYTVSIQKQTAGTAIRVTATDASGNVSAATSRTVIARDTEAPEAPSVTDTVNSDSTSIVGCAEPLSYVKVLDGAEMIASGNADAQGNFAIVISPLPADKSLSLTAEDAAGNVSAATTVVVQSRNTLFRLLDADSKTQYVFDAGSTATLIRPYLSTTVPMQNVTVTVDLGGAFVASTSDLYQTWGSAQIPLDASMISNNGRTITFSNVSFENWLWVIFGQKTITSVKGTYPITFTVNGVSSSIPVIVQ